MPAGLRVIAELTLVPTEEGGRKRPIASGYRPSFWFGDEDANGVRMMSDATIHLDDRARLYPGQTARCTLVPFNPEWRWDELAPGATFEACEGNRRVADVTVIRILAE